ETLARSRAYPERDVALLFSLWLQAAEISDLPPQRNLWQSIRDYTQNLDMWMGQALTTDALRPLNAEATQLLSTLSVIIATFRPGYFREAAARIEAVGRPSSSGGNQQATPFVQAKEAMGQHLTGLKRQLWLGYAGRMLLRVEHGQMGID